MPYEDDATLAHLPEKFREMLLASDDCMARQEYYKALVLYKTMADEFPDYADGWLGLTRINLLIKEYNKSAEYYLYLIETLPDFDPYNHVVPIVKSDIPGGVKFAFALAQKDLYKDALKLLDECTGVYPEENIRILLEQAKHEIQELYRQFMAKKLEEYKEQKMRETIKKAVLYLIGAVALVFIAVGLIYGINRLTIELSIHEGINCLSIGKTKLKDYKEYRQNLGEAGENLRNAKEKFQKAVSLDPSSWRGQLYLAKTYMALLDYEFAKGITSEDYIRELLTESSKAIDIALEINPQDPETNITAARVYFENQNKQKAKEYCEKGLTLARAIPDSEQENDKNAKKEKQRLINEGESLLNSISKM